MTADMSLRPLTGPTLSDEAPYTSTLPARSADRPNAGASSFRGHRCPEALASARRCRRRSGDGRPCSRLVHGRVTPMPRSAVASMQGTLTLCAALVATIALNSPSTTRPFKLLSASMTDAAPGVAGHPECAVGAAPRRVQGRRGGVAYSSTRSAARAGVAVAFANHPGWSAPPPPPAHPAGGLLERHDSRTRSHTAVHTVGHDSTPSGLAPWPRAITDGRRAHHPLGGCSRCQRGFRSRPAGLRSEVAAWDEPRMQDVEPYSGNFATVRRSLSTATGRAAARRSGRSCLGGRPSPSIISLMMSLTLKDGVKTTPLVAVSRLTVDSWMPRSTATAALESCLQVAGRPAPGSRVVLLTREVVMLKIV